MSALAAETRGAATSSGVNTSVSVSSLINPTPSSFVLVGVGHSTATRAVTSIVCSTATFAKAAEISSANRKLELWVGYNFPVNTWISSLAVIRNGANNDETMIVHARVIDVLADASQAPSFTASAGNTSTGTTADSNSLTPAIGDLMFTGVIMASTSADSTARTHTGNSFHHNSGVEAAVTRIEVGWVRALAAAETKEQWTLAASAEWAAVQALWTPPNPGAAGSGILLKGRPTQALDAASSF